MTIYFENGPITDTVLYAHNNEKIFKIDAGMGYEYCKNKLRYIDDNYLFETKVYTNFIDALSNYWCWDDKKGMPMAYLKSKNDSWIHT